MSAVRYSDEVAKQVAADREAGMAWRAIAKKHGFKCHHTAQQLAARTIKPRHTDRVQQAIALIEKGKSISLVADELGITKGSLSGLLLRAGYKRQAPATQLRGPSGLHAALRKPPVSDAIPQTINAHHTRNPAHYRKPPHEIEAERAIAEFLARKSVTVCPPAAVAEINNGFGMARPSSLPVREQSKPAPWDAARARVHRRDRTWGTRPVAKHTLGATP